MKKSLIALAILGSVSGAAMAQSSVSIYGIVDMGLSHSSSAGDSRTGIDSGLQSGSRLGFKGTEDLGGGLKANFVLESGLNADTGGFAQNNTAFGRQAWLGLEGGFGAVKLGRQYTPIRNAVESVDPFNVGSTGSALNLLATGGVIERVNNAVTYELPAMNGLTGSAQYSFGETNDSVSANSGYGFGLGYKIQALDLQFAYGKQNATGNVGGLGALDVDAKDLFLGGTYDFGVAKAHASYSQRKIDGNIGKVEDSRSYLIGVSAPFGPHSVRASYIRNDVRNIADADTTQLALGYGYELSKRTNVYATYAHVTNDNNVALRANANGANSNVYQVGLRHKF